MGPDFQGQNWALYNADCVEILAGLPDESIDLAVFSSPFSSLYIYSDSERDMGNSNSHEEFLHHHAFMAAELFRVMKPGGIICDHLKDTVFYQNSSETGESGIYPFSDEAARNYRNAGFALRARVTVWRDPVREMQKSKNDRLLYKNIRENSRVSAMGMPEYVIVMRKGSHGVKFGAPVRHVAEGDYSGAVAIAREVLPENASDTAVEDVAAEKIFPLDQWQQWASPVWMDTNAMDVLNARFKGNGDEKHLCPMPLDLIKRCLTMWSNPGDVVLDPFNGIGSTGFQAVKMRRRYIGIELKPEYAATAAKFLAEAEASQATLFQELSA
ncbi:DNA-methyltransferase [Fuscibacter oryzae]|uniref:Methyltransferase n=1 Tax=Fuscibacter oryzae TaxID=2803939 RepID=A0A8J7MRU7_9RHOB|nr:site-specific DNA-methyltransferase [Fuscibacter oryzae]MBL4929352.1 site-specific DNA-methyltransferase [Fuscibacter oryzae]